MFFLFCVDLCGYLSDGDQRPDIAMFMIDAFSRLHFHRRMTAVKAMLVCSLRSHDIMFLC